MSDIPGNNYNKLQVQYQLDPWNSSLEKPDYETNFKFHDCYRSQGNVKWWGMAKGVDSATGKGGGWKLSWGMYGILYWPISWFK